MSLNRRYGQIAASFLWLLALSSSFAAGTTAVTKTIAARIEFGMGTATAQWHGKLGLAHTAAQRALGFMYRQQIPADEGLLFVYAEPQPLFFWMQNTYVPLIAMSFDRNCHLVRSRHLQPRDLQSIALGTGMYVVEIPAVAGPESIQTAQLVIPEARAHGLPPCFTDPAGTDPK